MYEINFFVPNLIAMLGYGFILFCLIVSELTNNRGKTVHNACAGTALVLIGCYTLIFLVSNMTMRAIKMAGFL